MRRELKDGLERECKEFCEKVKNARGKTKSPRTSQDNKVTGWRIATNDR